MGTAKTATTRTDPLERAVERYRARFGEDEMPCLFWITTDRSKSVAAALLERAVKAGRPLRYGEVAAAIGGSEPPMSGCI